MFKAIGMFFGKLMLFLYNLVGNYGVAIILFALVVKLIMLPFQLKSKKSMMRMSRMSPRLKELEKKFGHDQQRYQQEVSKFYKEEGVNPMGGCLWTLLPYPILIALYSAIRYPLTYMMGVAEDLLTEGGAIAQKLSELGYVAATGRSQFYEQIAQSQFITEHFSDFAGISDKLQQISYKFLGLNLGEQPQFSFWNWDFSSADKWLPALGLFMIPVLSAFLSWLSMKVANASNPQTMDQQQSMKTMNLIMPLMSIWICFTMPGVMGIYWIAQSVFMMLQDAILNKIFGKQLDIEDADRIEREKAREAELEAKRAETERLKAEGATVENKNTSKRNKRAIAAQKEVERKAAEARAARAARRARLGLPEEEIPASQVDNRRYARGRAYVPDRYTNPEEAEAKTQAAAEESAEYDELTAVLEVTETEAEELETEAVETAEAEEIPAEESESVETEAEEEESSDGEE